MFSHLRFPLVYVLEAIIWVPLLTSFAAVVSFVAAEPIATLSLNGGHLPSSWNAAVPNHGAYMRGYLISDHPFAFSVSLIGLIASGFVVIQLQRAQVAQRTAASGEVLRNHNIARAVTFAVWICYGLVFYRYVVSGGIRPA